MDYVVELLDGDCTVYHAPWSGDGGSLDTRYMLQCLPMFLSSSFYEPVQYDAIIFNAGIHDIDAAIIITRLVRYFLLYPNRHSKNGIFVCLFVCFLFLLFCIYCTLFMKSPSFRKAV